MKVCREKVGKGVWEFRVGKRVVAIMKKTLNYKRRIHGSKKTKPKIRLYSLTWYAPGLLMVCRKRKMGGVFTTSEYFPSSAGMFTNYSQADSPFSSPYVKSQIEENLTDYKKRSPLFL